MVYEDETLMLGLSQRGGHPGAKKGPGGGDSGAKIQSLNWALDGTCILVTYRVVNRVILWDIEHCTKRADIELDFDLIKAKLFPFNSRYCIVSGAKVVLIDLLYAKVLNLNTLEDETVKHRVYFSLTPSQAQEEVTEA